MLDRIPRYDMHREVPRQHLRGLILALSLPDLMIHRNRIEKIGMEDIKPPYLLLCNHNAFMDFKVASRAMWPGRANFVVAIDGFAKREWLLRLIGCICTRKFTTDLALVYQLQNVIKRGDIAVMYPEARYSLCGTTAVLPASLGKLVRTLKVPVVVLMCHGHHVNSPFYHLPDHGVRDTRAEMKCILRPEEVGKLNAAQISDRIRDAFQYDDFRWQQENHCRITYPRRAEGLHKVLYQCSACGTEYEMSSKGTQLTCRACGRSWELDEYGFLRPCFADTEQVKSFSHVPDWYEWERENVRREVEAGTYSFSCTARVDALPNADGYIDIGTAHFAHDMEGFHVTGIVGDTAAYPSSVHEAGRKRTNLHRSEKEQEKILAEYGGEAYEFQIPVGSIYSCHIEYDYLGQVGDCVDLNLHDDTFYIYPQDCGFAVTKIALATEELYQHAARRQRPSGHLAQQE